MLETLPIARLRENCYQNSQIYRRNPEQSDGTYCYELFRRAVHGDAEAWQILHDHYTSMIRKEVVSFAYDENEVEDLVQDTWARVARYITAETWSRFPNLAHILSYLSKCAKSSGNDLVRRRHPYGSQTVDSMVEMVDSSLPGPEETILTQEGGEHLWQKVLVHCKDQEDILLAEASWMHDLSPREIFALYPQRFADLKEVYKRKRNLLDRLRRDDTISL